MANHSIAKTLRVITFYFVAELTFTNPGDALRRFKTRPKNVKRKVAISTAADRDRLQNAGRKYRFHSGRHDPCATDAVCVVIRTRRTIGFVESLKPEKA